MLFFTLLKGLSIYIGKSIIVSQVILFFNILGNKNDNQSIINDNEEIFSICIQIINEMSVPDQLSINIRPFISEMFYNLIYRVKANACELHNIAGIVGGIAGQEIIKLVTHQYVPINNTG
jgi:hypothetical protein